jgi:Leucine-rich repeat (LRR) protein
LKKILLLFFSVLCIGLLFAQDWRHVKKEKVYRELDEAINNKEKVKNLELYDYEGSFEKLALIGQMKNLQFLSIDESYLDSLPDGIFQLPNLRTLSLINNKFRELPAGIGNLKTLEYLVMYDNEIESIPDWIGELRNLETLILPRNNISYVSPAIGTLSKLKYLSFTGTFEQLPATLGDLKALEELHIRGERLKTLPATIGKLKRLEVAEWGEGALEVLPESIGQLKRLRSLQLHANNLRHLPKSIDKLVNLELLTLNYNDSLEFDLDISGMKNLRHISMSGKKIIRIPESLRFCKQLKQIEITGTSIKIIPDWICDLKKLYWLNLEGNKIQAIPACINALSKLEVVWLHRNNIDSVPPTVFNSPSLRIFYVDDNPVRHIPVEISHSTSLKTFGISNTKIAYEEYKYFRKKLRQDLEIPHTSTYFFENEESSCYNDDFNIPALKTFNRTASPPKSYDSSKANKFTENGEMVFTKIDPVPAYKLGKLAWQKFIDSLANFNHLAIGDTTRDFIYTDSVVLNFVIRNKGGISNITAIHFQYPTFKNEAVRLLKLSCPYWVPYKGGGRYVHSVYQQSFVFSYSKIEGITRKEIKVYDP